METTGLWRDEEHVVICRESARFTERCIWTDDPTQGLTEVRIRYSFPPKLAFSIWKGIHFAGQQPREARISLPIGSDWKGASDARIAALGRTILGIGLTLAFVVALGFAFLACYEGQPANNTVMAVGIVVAILGAPAIILTIVGLAWPYIEIPTSRNAPMAVAYLDDRYVWIAQANRKLLNELPAWSGTPVKELTRQERTSFFGFIQQNWIGILVLLLLGIGLGVLRVMTSPMELP